MFTNTKGCMSFPGNLTLFTWRGSLEGQHTALKAWKMRWLRNWLTKAERWEGSAGRRQSETEGMHASNRAALSLSKEQGQGSQFGVDAEPQLT